MASSSLHLTPEGAAFIARFEGFRQQSYVCPAGHLTIGYGHRIRPGETFASLTEAEALDLLMQDAVREAAPVARALTVPLTSYQADALISLAFNVGGGAVRKSTLLKRLNAGLLSDAAEEFMRWNQAGGKTSRGLTRRRLAEKTLFLTGDYGSES